MGERIGDLGMSHESFECLEGLVGLGEVSELRVLFVE